MSSFLHFFHKLFLHNSLSSNTGMISTWNIQSFIILHTFSAHNGVLHSYCQGMPNMKIACNIWRWQTYYELLWILGFLISTEKFILVPPFVPIFLDCYWIVGILHLSCIFFNLNCLI